MGVSSHTKKKVCAENLKTIVIIFMAQVINSRKNSCPLLKSGACNTKKPSEKEGLAQSGHFTQNTVKRADLYERDT
jgi:hypothetical protein